MQNGEAHPVPFPNLTDPARLRILKRGLFRRSGQNAHHRHQFPQRPHSAGVLAVIVADDQRIHLQCALSPQKRDNHGATGIQGCAQP